MAVKRLVTLRKELLQAGYPASCSITIIEQAHTPNQRVHKVSVDRLDTLANAKIVSPATMVIGDAGDVLH
jgi:siroheme synthase